jgi:type I restriction enzyme S subunit
VTQIVAQSNNPLLKKHGTWERVELCLIANVLNGFAFDSQKFKKNAGTPLIRIRDIGRDFTDCNFVGDFDFQYLVKTGDLLIGMDGDFNCSRWKGSDALLNQRVCKIIQKNKYYSQKFLDYVLPAYLQEINKNTSSLTVKHLSSQSIKEIPLPLPPLPEQYRIVTKIEELFTQLDAGVASLKKVQAQLKRYRQAVLKAAFEGRLTQEWREQHKGEIESVQELLKNIRTIDENASKPRITNIADLKIKELPLIPSGWVYAKIDDIAYIGTGATPSRTKSKYWDNGTIPWVTSSAVNWSFVKNTEEKITEIALKETRVKIFPVHTLIVALYGEGKTRGKISELLIDACTNQALATLNLKFDNNVFRAYVKLFFQEQYENIRRHSSGGVQPNLNLSIIKKMVIPIPPLSEQKVIVFEIERNLSQIDHLENTITTSFHQAETLRHSILKQAFEGKLVPQDPNDEPALILLERIKAEKSLHTAIVKKGKTLQPKSPKRKIKNAN